MSQYTDTPPFCIRHGKVVELLIYRITFIRHDDPAPVSPPQTILAGKPVNHPYPPGTIVVSNVTRIVFAKRQHAADAASAAEAERLYETFVDRLRALGLRVSTGRFQAKMAVSLTNDGPVTLLLDSKKVF